MRQMHLVVSSAPPMSLLSWLAALSASYLNFLPPFFFLTAGLCTLLSASFLLHRKFTNHNGHPPPPGPRALPIIGHLHLLGVNPHQSFYNLSKSYGPLMSLRLGSVPAIVASTPSVAMEILHTHDKIFSARPPMLTLPRHCLGCLDILFSSPGPYWRFMRQICVSEFFSNKRLDYFQHIRKEELGSTMRSILATTGLPIPVLRTVKVYANNVISRMVIGKRMKAVGAANGEGVDVSIFEDLLSVVGAFNPGDYIPWLAWTDLMGLVKRSKQIGRRVKVVVQELIDSRRATSVEGAPAKDFLDVLLQAAVDTKHKELELRDVNIRAILMNMFVAGTDTTAATTEWALSELLANPEKLKKAQEELDEVVGRERMVQESDVPNLPYLRAVIKESMRLHPVGPLLAPHYSLEECQIGGYRVPANTIVYINSWAIGRDPKTWENPLQFWPERFVGSSIDVMGKHYELIPFGAGRRMCPGYRLGLLNVESMLANLLHAFDWSTSANPDMEEKFSITMPRKNPLFATPTPRLAKAVIEEYT